LPRKNIWLATAISVAVIIPSYAVPQVMSASSVAVNAHLFAADFHDDVIRVENDKDKEIGKKKAGKGQSEKKHKAESKMSKGSRKADKEAGKYFKRVKRTVIPPESKGLHK
jgi:hypothetical protein